MASENMVTPGFESVFLDHIGIAVFDLATAIHWHVEVLGGTVTHREVIELDQVEEVTVDVGGTIIQLVTPISDESPVFRFLKRRGEGLHHVAYAVNSIEGAVQRAMSSGSSPLDPWPRSGSKGTSVVFLHPKDNFGTLVELVERIDIGGETG